MNSQWVRGTLLVALNGFHYREYGYTPGDGQSQLVTDRSPTPPEIGKAQQSHNALVLLNQSLHRLPPRVEASVETSSRIFFVVVHRVQRPCCLSLNIATTS